MLHPGAVIDGDVLALAGQVRLEGGEVTGEVRTLSAPSAEQSPAAPTSPVRHIFRSLAGTTGVFLTLLLAGFGLVLFGKSPLEVTSDTVRSSFSRAFIVGLLGQILVLPTFGMLVVGLILTVAGILLIPFVVIVFALLLVAGIVGGALAVAHAMGESITRRQMAQGRALSPNSYRYLVVGLACIFAPWLVWTLFGWAPVAGELMLGAAILISWLLASVGFGAALLSRGGLKEQFAGAVHPARDAHRRIPLGHASLWCAGSEAAGQQHPAPRVTAARRYAVMRHPLGFIVLVGPTAAAAALHAQTLREYSSTRQDHGESRLSTTIQYAGGTLNLVPATSGILYALRLTYDADRFAPVAQFDPSVPQLTLGTETLPRSGGVRVSHRGTPPAATIALSTRADLDLDIELGAAEATLELGGIRISRLKVQTGASKTRGALLLKRTRFAVRAPNFRRGPPSSS